LLVLTCCCLTDVGNGKVMDEGPMSVEQKLGHVRNQLNELSMAVNKFTSCELSSLLLEIRLGEIKVCCVYVHAPTCVYM